MSAGVAQGLSSNAVCAAVGISYRMLDYWIRLGLIHPSISEAAGSGTQRRFSIEDVHVLRVVGLLMGQGVGIEVCRAALPLVREAAADGCRWLVITKTPRLDIAVVAEAELEAALRGGSATVVDLSPTDTAVAS